MYYVYILYSAKNKSYYIGYTEDIVKRLKQHNAGQVRSTKSKRPWNVAHIESFESKIEAYQRERKIKSYKGGEAFKKLISS